LVTRNSAGRVAQDVLEFHPIVVNGQIDVAVVKSPSDVEVPCDMEKLVALLPEKSSSAPPPPKLEPIPLEFTNASQFMNLLSQFVVEEESVGKMKAVWRQFTARQVTWRSSTEFYFSCKESNLRTLRPAMEIILSQPTTKVFCFPNRAVGMPPSFLLSRHNDSQKLYVSVRNSAKFHSNGNKVLSWILGRRTLTFSAFSWAI
jgi:hypothetical protein